ncbi:MAG TPA: zf-HC2 domain-containing protein [Vicinamibacterales bacterium]|nr:zf-HC2 domain-containing protein [Vicinamibacterales bacterium]
MSIKFTCDDKQTLVSYLYGEIDHETRQAVDAHLDACAVCAAEVTALGDARSELGLWVPPDVELDFTIVKKSALPPSNVLRPARWWTTVPAWAQAAAAILVLAAGAAIANVQVKSGPEGFSVSTGWMTPVVSEPSGRDPAAVRIDGPTNDQLKAQLASLEQKLRDEIRSTRDQETRVAARTPVDEATIRRVQQLIAASEQRHEQALAMRLIEFQRDVNMQRRADLQNIGRGMVNYDEQLQRQRQTINNLIRVSAAPQQ